MLLKSMLKLKLKLQDQRLRLKRQHDEQEERKKNQEGVEEEELRTFHLGGREVQPGREWPMTGSLQDLAEGSSATANHRLIKIGRDASFEKLGDLEFQLSQKVINSEALQRIACSGHLDAKSRAIVWKLFLGYLPAERCSWAQVLSKSRLRYAELKQELLVNPSIFSRTNDEESSSESKQYGDHIDGLLDRHKISDANHPLSLANGSVWGTYFKDAEIVMQIERDLLRTHPDITFFSGNSSYSRKNREAMRNILFIFAKLNPAIGYVQGMNEVLAPLYYVFSTNPDEKSALNMEADTFGCFIRLLSGSIDHFVQQLDGSSVGILSTLSHLSELVKTNDEELWRHLEISQINTQFYAFRWITLLLSQEFKFNSIMRIWDCLLSNTSGVQEMLLRVCCAMLLCVKKELLNGDFISNLKLLQHYPEIDLDHLLDVAHHLTPTTNNQPFGSFC